MNEMIYLPVLALVISVISLYFSVRNWRAGNRPLVTVRVSALGMSGNVSTPLSLVVENTGNRPAKNIRLRAQDEDINRSFKKEPGELLSKEIFRCFSEKAVIPVLANGKHTVTAFGLMGSDPEATWEPQSTFDVAIYYEDLDGRKFTHSIPIRIADDDGFAGSVWSAAVTNN